MHVGTLAAYGFSVIPPLSWELAGVSGHTDRGWLVLTQGDAALTTPRRPVVRLSWHRSQQRPDPEDALKALGRELTRRVTNCRQLRTNVVPPGVLVGTWEAADGIWQAAVRDYPDTGLTLTVLALAAEAPVTGLLISANAYRVVEPWPWRLHGLAVELPSNWHLRGILHQAGLVRALWERRPPVMEADFGAQCWRMLCGLAGESSQRPDAVLVLRRMACAELVLKRRTPLEWLRAGLASTDRIVDQCDEDGHAQVVVQRPVAGWWRRWRGVSEHVELDAWRDGDGRLLMRECRNASLPTPEPETLSPRRIASRSGDQTPARGVTRGASNDETPMTGRVQRTTNDKRRTAQVESVGPRVALAAGVTLMRSATGGVRLRAPEPQKRWWPQRRLELELDELGAWVAERLDGRTVAALALELSERLRLSPREAEVALGDFLRQLLGRHLVTLSDA